MVASWEIDQGANLQCALTTWLQSLRPSDIQDSKYQAALLAFDAALIETINYMKDRRDGSEQDSARERQLTDLWSKASRAISPLDQDLSNACMMKGLGWTDPAAWDSARKNGLNIGVEDMQNARMLLNKKRVSATKSDIPSWFPVAGVTFAAVTIVFLMFVLLGPTIGPDKKDIFDVLIAFCASASGAFLGGTAAANGQIPLFKNSPVTFSAGGGVAIFIIVFLILHLTDGGDMPRACRDPSNGVDHYTREYDVTRESPEMGGGHSRGEWCDNVIAALRGEHPSDAFSVKSTGERTNNHCAPFNCPQYVYSCTVHVKTDPVYNLKVSPACP